LFIDVPASHWANKDVLEMSDVPTYGYDSFIKSIPYNIMEEGYPVIDKIVQVNTMTNSINLGVRVVESPLNPISVYQDGVEIGYMRIESTPNDTIIHLKRYVPQGSLVRVVAHGRPKMRQYTNPSAPGYNPLGAPEGVNVQGVELPTKTLSYKSTYSGYSYIYDPSYSYYSEKATWKGTQLKRVPCIGFEMDLPAERPSINTIYYVQNNGKFYEWDVIDNTFKPTFTPSEQFLYTITSDEKFVTTFYLRNEVINFSYIIGLISNGVSDPRTYRTFTQTIWAESNNVIYTNRFFPDVFVSKPQFIAFLDRLRVHLLLTYSSYKSVEEVIIQDKPMSDSAFIDIRYLPEDYYWWWPYLSNLENLKFKNGVYILNYGVGLPQDDSEPRTWQSIIHMVDGSGNEVPVTRGEAAYLLNRFRKYFLEILC
jgi:hypothetical protein